MDLEEFVRVVAREPARTVRHTVQSMPAQMVTAAGRPEGLRLTDLLSAPGRSTQLRELQYRHILGPPAAPDTISTLQHQLSPFALPSDLVALVQRINGIHLWANATTGRSYFGVAPIQEWIQARVKLHEMDDSILDHRYIAISYHQDDASHIVLDLQSGKYFLMDSAGPDTSTPIASSVDELLGWLWKARSIPSA